MITFRDVALRRGSRQLLSDVNLTVNVGYRVGVLGRNGVGKSSLFALLLNELQADRGEVDISRGMVTASVAQEIPATERSAMDFTIDGDRKLRELEADIARLAATDAADGLALAHSHAAFEQHGGYTARARAGELLHGLGFRAAEWDRPVNSFSGGWRMRLNLAQALMCPSDLLLLDEPTNHLDLDAVLWLEEWLQGYRGTLLCIAHDRDFLEQVATHILHFDGRSAVLYSGTLSTFERQLAARLASQQALRMRQERSAAKIRQFVERFRAKASKARQAQSRLKVLEKMELIAVAHSDAAIEMAFEPPRRLPAPLLTLQDVAVGYQDRVVLKGVNLTVQPGDRLGLIGPNGAGKSTLMKLLAGLQMPLQGERITAEYLQIGYLAQHQVEQLDPDAQVLQLLRRTAPEAREQDLLDYLGHFGFSGDRAHIPVGVLSGGEKARLMLSLLIKQRPNLLLLDEPTNHLDLEMRDALAMAIAEFPGAVVLVSHDRHLLTAVSQDLRLVESGRVVDFAGDLDDYRTRLTAPGASADLQPPAAMAHTAAARKQQRQEAAQVRQRLQPLMEKMGALEQRLQQLAREREVLAEKLIDPAMYADNAKDALKALLQTQGRLNAEIEQVETDWLEAMAEYERKLDS